VVIELRIVRIDDSSLEQVETQTSTDRFANDVRKNVNQTLFHLLMSNSNQFAQIQKIGRHLEWNSREVPESATVS
jgi:hypothetical protein